MSLKDYTRKDIAEIRQYLVDTIEKIDNAGAWTDRNESDIGMVILELMAGVGDMLNFYIDKQALENYLPTVTQRKNLKRILTLINYEMKGPVSAVCTGSINLTKYFGFDITIPKYFQVSYERKNQGNIYYATAQDCQILAGSTNTLVPLRQGIVVTINLQVADLMRTRILTINDTEVAYDSIVLTIDETEWTCVPDVLVDENYGEKYSVHENKDDQTYIEFGYHWREYLPADYRKPVQIKYLRTAGGSGAVKEGLIRTVESDLIVVDPKDPDEEEIDITDLIQVNNLEDATGGSDREDMDTARLKAPHIAKTRGLMTTLDDYQAFVDHYPGVYKSACVDWTVENSYFVDVPYKVDAYVVTNDKDVYDANKEFCSELKNAMKEHLWCSINFNVYPAEIVDIDLVVEVYTSTEMANRPGLKREVEDIYTDYFNKFNRSFNESFTRGKLEALVADNSRLTDYVEVLEPDENIKLNEIQFPRLNKLDVYVRDAVNYNNMGGK